MSPLKAPTDKSRWSASQPGQVSTTLAVMVVPTPLLPSPPPLLVMVTV